MSEIDQEIQTQFVTYSILPNFSFDLQNRLIRLLHELFNENPSLMDLKTTISFNKIGTRGTRTCLGTLIFSDESGISSAVSDLYPNYQSLIYFSNFQLRDISDRTIFINRDSTNFWSQIYNPNWNQKLGSRRYGINVLKKLSVKGYLFNFNDVKKLIDECIESRLSGLLDCINEFYYASNRNILVALTTTTGHLIFRLQAVKKILECNDDITVKKCFLNIFTCYLKVLKMFTEMNIRTIQENVSGILEQGVWNELVNGDNLSRRFRNVFSDEPEEAIDRLKRNISEYINSTLENAFRDRIFGVSDQYSYARILNQIVKDNAYKEKQKFGDGFKKGVRFGLKFEMLGWEPCNPNFSDDNRDVNIWWKKDVDIYPSSFIHKCERYLIPEKYRNKFHISELYINQDGRMRAIGNHPNVSGSSVCMGDLTIDFTNDSIDLNDYLVQAEELLDMINYDSAYRNEYLTELLEVSEKQDSLFSSYDDKSIFRTSSIRELHFGDNNNDEDEEEEEEILSEEHENLQFSIRNNNGEVIENAILQVNNNEEESFHIYYDSIVIGNTLNHVNISIEENQQHEDVYQLDESIVLNDISTVDQEGNITRIINPIHESFSLGDSNLMGVINE